VALGDGEEVDGIDFSLTKGGVITGRVTYAEERPIVEQYVNLMRVDERGQRIPSFSVNPFMFNTDDRGIYRVFGLVPGRYKVSVGDAPDSGMVRIGFGGGTYSRTFHPDITDESRATIIEVTAGGEATGIDIKMGGASKSFVATGRVIDADTGKQLLRRDIATRVVCASITPDGTRVLLAGEVFKYGRPTDNSFSAAVSIFDLTTGDVSTPFTYPGIDGQHRTHLEQIRQVAERDRRAPRPARRTKATARSRRPRVGCRCSLDCKRSHGGFP
jgi:hypothetical protein